MQTKSHAIDRLLRERPHLRERRFGLPYIGARHDGEQFNPTVQAIADAIDFYGFGGREFASHMLQRLEDKIDKK